MGTEENKAIVRRWIEHRTNEAVVSELLTDDFVFRTMHRSPAAIIYTWNRQQFMAAPKATASVLKKPIVMKVVGMIGEGDQVAVETEGDGELHNGKRYANAYHFVFVLRGGKIAEVREYSCSHLIAECFGAFDPNNPRASRAAQP
jgi:ketosteroid isomerase-like protein